MKPPAGYITKDEAATVMGCEKRTIANYMRLGRIPFYRFGRRVLFKSSELLEAVKASHIPRTVQDKQALPPTAYDSQMDVLKMWTHVCQWLRLIQNGKDEKHARLAKDCLVHIAKFVE